MFTTKDTKASADRLSYDIVGAAIEVHRGYRLDLKISGPVIVEIKAVSKVLQFIVLKS